MPAPAPKKSARKAKRSPPKPPPPARWKPWATLALGVLLGAGGVLLWLWPEASRVAARADPPPTRRSAAAPVRPTPARAETRPDLGGVISETARDLGYARGPLEWTGSAPPTARLRFRDREAGAMGRRVLAAELRRKGLAAEDAEADAAPALLVRRGTEVRRLLFAAPRAGGPALALVIDDVGHDRAAARRLLRLGVPLTFAVLPYTAHGASLAAEARAAGAQVILHLPMEPKGYPEENPGPGALLSAMDETSLRAMAARDLDWVGPVRGLNNHMGSRLTEDRASMDRLMRELKARGMFFLDSRTSPASVAAAAARAAGVPVLERSVFLDDARDEAAIRKQLERAIALAEKRGRPGVVAIGHPYQETYAVLAEFAPRLREGPVRPVLLDELVARAEEGAS